MEPPGALIAPRELNTFLIEKKFRTELYEDGPDVSIRCKEESNAMETVGKLVRMVLPKRA